MRATITVKLVDNEVATIEAEVFGDWAAHPGIDTSCEARMDWWVVTHVPNGRRIRCPGQLSELEAVALARSLHQRAARLPVYTGESERPDPTELSAVDPAFTSAAKVVRSIVFDTIGRVDFT